MRRKHEFGGLSELGGPGTIYFLAPTPCRRLYPGQIRQGLVLLSTSERVEDGGLVDVLDLGSPRPMGVGGVRRVPGYFRFFRKCCGIRVERVLVG